MRQREIDALKGKARGVVTGPQAETTTSRAESLPGPEIRVAAEPGEIETPPADDVPPLSISADDANLTGERGS
jgi:hypothetical protein